MLALQHDLQWTVKGNMVFYSYSSLQQSELLPTVLANDTSGHKGACCRQVSACWVDMQVSGTAVKGVRRTWLLSSEPAEG